MSRERWISVFEQKMICDLEERPLIARQLFTFGCIELALDPEFDFF